MKKLYLLLAIYSFVFPSFAGETYTASHKNSDYYIYATYSGILTNCSVGSSTSLFINYVGGGSANATQFPNYNSTGFNYGIGPSTQGAIKFQYTYGNGLFCWGSTGPLVTRYATTRPVKPPLNVVATFDISDTNVVVTWDVGGSHIPDHVYRIYRDSVLQDFVSGSTSSWTDNTAIPGVEYLYSVVTYTEEFNQESIWESSNGKAFDLNVRTETLPTGVKILWNRTDNILMENIIIERRKENETPEYVETIDNPVSISYSDLIQGGVPIPGYSYTYIVTPFTGSMIFRSDSISGNAMPNGSFSGTVTSPTGGPVAGVIVCADLISDIPQGTDTIYCDTTDGNGEFTIQNIYYYEEASFKLSPYLEGHGFDPVADTFSLALSNHSLDNINFIDTSAFTVSGNVFQVFNGDTCREKDVEILVDGIPWNYISDESGNFEFSVGSIGTYTFSAQYNNHEFMPSEQVFYISDDLENISFEDTTTFTFEGDFSGPCDIYIGNADLRIYNISGACYDTIISTDDLGHYSVKLPAWEYFVELETFYPDDASEVTVIEVEEYFNFPKEIDLREGDFNLNYTYRKTPELQITGFDNYGCGSYEGVPIVEQAKTYVMNFDVIENFNGNSCPTDTGIVVVTYTPSDGEVQLDTLELVNGSAQIEFTPDRPNIIAPYLNLFEVTAFVEGQTDNYSQQILIEGNRPREATFVSVSPEIPFLILRDPPGDASHSYLSENTTFNTAISISASTDISANLWAQLKLGTKFETGKFVFIETEVWGQVKGSLEIGASFSSQTELGLSITNSETFSTSGNEDITGQEGDVFGGASMNMVYALTDIIAYDTANCEVLSSLDMIMAPNGFETTFLYTENHIREVLIPNLEQIHELSVEAGNDSAGFYFNQIQTWEQILALNIELKNDAEFVENRSFSNGASYESSQEITTSLSSTIGFSMYIENSIAVEAGIDIGGVGASFGSEIKMRMTLGASTSAGISSTVATGYALNDDDVGDYFSVDILEDRTYGTPVFNLVSGSSSCPWELGTQPRDGVQLLSNSYVQEVEDPDDPAVFILNLGNTSQSDEERTYHLVFLQESNPDGAVITLGGSEVQGGIPTPYTIPAGNSIDATVTVSRGAASYDYNNLRFALFSPCDGAIYDEVSLSVHFLSTCSDISIIQPQDNWLLNQNDNDLITIQLSGYDLSTLETLAVQYSIKDANSWINEAIYEVEQLDSVMTEHDISFSEISDGEYDIRVKIACGNDIRYADVISGVVDRIPPTVYGIPSPSDGVLDLGDLISVNFDENIDCISLIQDNITLTNIETNQDISFQFGCSGDMIIILADTVGLDFADNTFRVTIVNFQDLYGNIADTVTWVFDVPGPEVFEIDDDEDSDGDGIINSEDNCQLSYNTDQADLDNDQIGDVCDSDIDGDNVINTEDNCMMIDNPEQSDIDGDGIGDLCDSDIDGDGIDNDIDNCPLVFNPNQEDSNSNGIGDACDATGIEDVALDDVYHLFNNYPNPFKGTTKFKYKISEDFKVLIRILDITGQEVDVLNEGLLHAGTHETTWFASDKKSGVYFYIISFTKHDGSIYRETKKMVIY